MSILVETVSMVWIYGLNPSVWIHLFEACRRPQGKVERHAFPSVFSEYIVSDLLLSLPIITITTITRIDRSKPIPVLHPRTEMEEREWHQHLRVYQFVQHIMGYAKKITMSMVVRVHFPAGHGGDHQEMDRWKGIGSIGEKYKKWLGLGRAASIDGGTNGHAVC